MSVLPALLAGSLVLLLMHQPRPVQRLEKLTQSALAKNSAKPARRARSRRVKRVRARAEVGEVPVEVILDLLAASLRTGCPIPAAMTAVGSAIRGQHGAILERAAAHLSLGASWESAWTQVGYRNQLEQVAAALAPAWLNGAPVAGILQHAKRRIRQQNQARDRVAARQLGVRLIGPVAVCYLPAFIALGLIPVVLVLVRDGFSLL